MYQVYIIQCQEKRYYIGSTEDIEKRLNQHNSKDFKCWTNRFSNWKVVYLETVNSRTEALVREKEIKKMKGGIQFIKLLKNYSSLGS